MLLNLRNQEPNIDKTFLYVKYPFQRNYQLLINKREEAGIKHFKISRTFIDCLQIIGDVYKNLEDYNPTEVRKALIVFL